MKVSERASIDRKALFQMKKGKPSISISVYFNVLKTLRLWHDFLKLAVDDEFGGFVN